MFLHHPLDKLAKGRHGAGKVLHLVTLLQLFRLVHLDEEESEAVLLAGLDFRPPVTDFSLRIQRRVRSGRLVAAGSYAPRIGEGRASPFRRRGGGHHLLADVIDGSAMEKRRNILDSSSRIKDGESHLRVGRNDGEQAGLLLLGEPLHVEVDQRRHLEGWKRFLQLLERPDIDIGCSAPREVLETLDLAGSAREDDCLHFFSHSSA
jgi:hypothetical protein